MEFTQCVEEAVTEIQLYYDSILLKQNEIIEELTRRVDMELNRDAAEYEELRKSLATTAPVLTPDEPEPVDPAVNINIPDETETPDSETDESGDEPEPSAAAAEPQATENPAAEESAAPSQVLEERTVPDMAALKAQNDDFAAWIRIPGTNVDYPVVVSDDTNTT